VAGRISLLVSHDLRVLVEAVRGMDAEVRKQIRGYTRSEAAPIWKESIAQHTGTRLQNRVLVESARLSVSDSNVMLKSAQVGKLSSGVPVSLLAGPTEFGAKPGRMVASTSKHGKRYTRRLGGAFGAFYSKGHVFHPSTRDAIPRVASLWIQTAYRTVREVFEKAGV